jgi:hypothetical protein
MKINLLFHILLIALLIASFTFTFGGCTKTAQARDITANVVTSMQRINSCKISMNLTESYDVLPDDNNVPLGTTWDMQKLVDFANKKIELTTDVNNGIRTTLEFIAYLIGNTGYYVEITRAGGNINGQAITITPWLKYDLEPTWWTNLAEVASQLELIKSATSINILRPEDINGVACYVIELMPSPESTADWVLSQQQLSGPSLHWWFTDNERSRELYLEAYQSSSLKLWVTQNNYLVLRSDMQASFNLSASDVTPGDAGVPDVVFIPKDTNVTVDNGVTPDLGFASINVNFEAQLNFSNYNEHLDIQPPTEALGAAN